MGGTQNQPDKTPPGNPQRGEGGGMRGSRGSKIVKIIGFSSSNINEL